MGYSKAPEQPQSSARPICHSHTMTRKGREPATIRITAYRSSLRYALRHGRRHSWTKLHRKSHDWKGLPQGNEGPQANFPGNVVAHGRVVTSSHQITEVKQRRARLVLGWVDARCSSHAPAMCRVVGQASHITMPLSTQQ